MRWISVFVGSWMMAGLLAGCLSPVNARTARRYHDSGLAAEKAGNLKLAQRHYWRAFVNADLGFLSLGPKAYEHFDYSRVTGYLGDHREAERGFSNVLQWVEKAAPKADDLRAPALSEYARMLHDLGKHEKALPLFERALAELDRREMATKDPIGLAEFLDDYGESLRSTGRTAEAMRERARILREANKGVPAKHKHRRYVSPFQ